MIRRSLFFMFWTLITSFLVIFSFKYKDRSQAIVAQVENEVAAISYQSPVRIKKIYVVPGQQVDSGDVLIEVDHPNLRTDLIEKETLNHQLRSRINDLVDQYFANLQKVISETSTRIRELEALKNDSSRPEAEKQKLEAEIIRWREHSKTRNHDLIEALKQDTSLLAGQRRVLEAEINRLKNETSYLVTFAEFDGTVGNIHAQLNELVPAYENILSIYKRNPSIIRAYAKAGTMGFIAVGAEVLVKSTDREYSVIGKVLEIGYRVTEYPNQIDPGRGTKSYGQEIFIKIPDDNDFLNGEQVYVYPPRKK